MNTNLHDQIEACKTSLLFHDTEEGIIPCQQLFFQLLLPLEAARIFRRVDRQHLDEKHGAITLDSLLHPEQHIKFGTLDIDFHYAHFEWRQTSGDGRVAISRNTELTCHSPLGTKPFDDRGRPICEIIMIEITSIP